MQKLYALAQSSPLDCSTVPKHSVHTSVYRTDLCILDRSQPTTNCSIRPLCRSPASRRRPRASKAFLKYHTGIVRQQTTVGTEQTMPDSAVETMVSRAYSGAITLRALPKRRSRVPRIPFRAMELRHIQWLYGNVHASVTATEGVTTQAAVG